MNRHVFRLSQLRMIVAMTRSGVISVHNKIPWQHSGDLTRFKALTWGCPVIMGRKTWDSLGHKPLLNRANIILSRREKLETTAGTIAPRSHMQTSVSMFYDIERALGFCGARHNGTIWIIGGAEIYAAYMHLVSAIDVTYVPDNINSDTPGAVLFPPIPEAFKEGFEQAHPLNPKLTLAEYRWNRPV